ncbi:3'-5' exonuclease [Thalassotalea sp. PLHSN55]|uniref:3'-5' exonuclease n=1 Tax=Thalassotalea sp. PLHSN55 TaxID=3435888 RepID=UPI003F85C411
MKNNNNNNNETLNELKNGVIIDTETTGLSYEDEAIQIAVIDAYTGDTLFNEILKPSVKISEGASNIHGITNADVADKKTYPEIHHELMNILKDKKLFIYNGNFDIRILEQTACKYQLELPIHFEEQMFCVMEWYSQIWGDYSDYHQSYVWQKLTSACRQQNVETSGLTAHDALSDCIMTQRLISTLLLNGYEL